MGDRHTNPEKYTSGKLPAVIEDILERPKPNAPALFKLRGLRKFIGLKGAGNLSLALRLEVAIGNATDVISRAIARERDAGTMFHFAPLFFGFGIAAYFVVPAEPMLLALISACLIFSVFLWRLEQHGALWLLFCALALFFAGMSAAKIRTNLINTHPLQSQITAPISGTIVEVTQNRRGAPRYLIKTSMIEGVKENRLPAFIRLSATSKHQAGRPGDLITGLARLRPFSGPAYPGGFDFSFNSWYNSLGGSGFFMGKPEVRTIEKPNNSQSLTIRFQIFINQMRLDIAGRIRTALPGESGDVAVALIIGDRTGIDNATQDSLRMSGLAHVLAISGMHMALVSLTMVWCVRFLLALNMGVALRRSIKNWAVIAGFVTASSYLLISGMSLATQRAWIMISIMILAVLVSRKSITLRAVALAALAIMIIQPESLLSPGFQMSFAAVAAIVAAYEWLDERKRKEYDRPRPNRILRFFGALIFTSLIAGLATSLFAAYHFHRVAPLGVLTNLMAMPLVSTIVMPSALLSVLTMPFGVEQLALAPMGIGIEWVISISNFVNTLGSSGVTGHLGPLVLPLSFAGLFLLTMLKTFLRFSGVVLLLATLLFWKGSPMPDILLSEDGRAIAIKTASGELALMYPRRNKFIRDIWLRAFSNDKAGELTNGRNKSVTTASTGTFTDICNKDICTAKTLQGAKVYVVYDPELLDKACNEADILLAPRLRWVNCYENQPALIIKRGQLEEFGSHAIYLEKLTEPEIARSLQAAKNTGPKSARLKSTVKLQLEAVLTSDIPETNIYASRNLPANTPPLKQAIAGNETGNAQPSNIHREFKITKVAIAIENTNRPWNRHRKGRAAFLQD